MLRRTAKALQVDATRLFAQMNPEPLRGWKQAYAEKIDPDNHDIRREVRHKLQVETFGEGYDQVSAENFPVPAFMALTMTFMMAYLSLGDYALAANAEKYNDPRRFFNPKNADGSTQMPELPGNPSGVFADAITYRG